MNTLKIKELHPTDFKSILDNQVESKSYLCTRHIVNSLEDLEFALKQIDRELPTQAIIKPGLLTIPELKKMFRNYIPDVSYCENWHSLATYSLEGGKTLFILKDTSDRDNVFNARQYRQALSIFANNLAMQIKGQTEKESVVNLYDWIYRNFSYNAEGSTYMKVSNLAMSTMACNGFSRLVAEVLRNLDIKVKIKGGESHFWNLINIDDSTTTFDITTDIILNKPYYTLGSNTELHKLRTLEVGFYNAECKVINNDTAVDIVF